MTQFFHGTIKWYDSAKGFGFILLAAGGADVFYHVTGLGPGLTAEDCVPGVPVAYQMGQRAGRPQALNVVRSEGAGQTSAARMVEGVVAFFKWKNPKAPQNLFGFIDVPDLKEDVYVHVSDFDRIPAEQAALIDAGTRLRFRLEESSRRGRQSWRARDVELVDADIISLSAKRA